VLPAISATWRPAAQEELRTANCRRCSIAEEGNGLWRGGFHTGEAQAERRKLRELIRQMTLSSQTVEKSKSTRISIVFEPRAPG
jgi:hypothetical protein